MSSTPRSGRLLFGAIAGALILAVSALIWAAGHLEQRRRNLAQLALERTHQVLHVRLDGFFHEMAEDLREEAAAVSIPDTRLLQERWFPLLDTHWPIVAIHLADEYGNEIAVDRVDSSYIVSRISVGSVDGPPILIAHSAGPGHDVVRGPWLHQEDEDPREQVWFGKALEDTRNEPIWTLSPPDSMEAPLLQLSYLIRSGRPDLAYQVIMFTVDISRSSWLDTEFGSSSHKASLLVDDVGRSMLDPDTSTSSNDQVVMKAALSSWVINKPKAPFEVRVGSKTYRALVDSYTLNGQKLNTGIVIDPGPLESWLAPERAGLAVASGILALLIVLLILAWMRKRTSDLRIRKQAKRNRSQELKLAKALGEREVLNREVHHRVKNNLQVVSSLLNLQATRLEDGPVKNEFLRGKRRIDTIALVHHKLYGLADLRNVDLSLFFNDLVKALGELYAPRSRTVSHDVDTGGIKADQDTAIELGIIVCELVGNSYQHAFPYATGGHVEIKVRGVEGDLYRLTVKDNGIGIPDGGSRGTGKLGLEIVEALSEQLDGSFHMLSNAGMLFEVLFRMQRGPTTMVTEHDVP